MADQPSPAAFPDCQPCGNFRAGPAEICLTCAARQLTRPGPGACSVCAQHLAANGACPNELCSSPRRRIGKIHAIGYQSGALRRAISSYKYRGAPWLADVFGRLLVAWLAENLAADPPGVIVANPSFAAAGLAAASGPQFAHAEGVVAAAARIDHRGHWAFDTATPAAIIKTAPMLQSADAQAWSKRAIGLELRTALAVPRPGRTAGKFVLVYDDVCTTATQLNAVAGCLLDEGQAARVEAVVLARAPWRNRPAG
jgi:predicted amidophosphoribosyltransferase